jgi:hypothetical protein
MNNLSDKKFKLIWTDEMVGTFLQVVKDNISGDTADMDLKKRLGTKLPINLIGLVFPPIYN